jgi:hypothetical protein
MLWAGVPAALIAGVQLVRGLSSVGLFAHNNWRSPTSTPDTSPTTTGVLRRRPRTLRPREYRPNFGKGNVRGKGDNKTGLWTVRYPQPPR